MQKREKAVTFKGEPKTLIGPPTPREQVSSSL